MRGAMETKQLSEVAVTELDKSNFFDRHGLVRPQLSTLSAQPTVPF